MDLDKFTADAREAKQRALTAAALATDDGSSNLDGCAFHLEKGQRAESLIRALAAAGISGAPTRWLGRCVMVSPPGGGQAGKRYASNQAFYKHMSAAGWRVTPYYQVD